MIRRPHAFALVAGAALVLAGSALARPHASTTTLNGTVGPGYTITLKQGGKAVTTLKAGSYSFVIADKANIHNFVLEKKKGGSSRRS